MILRSSIRDVLSDPNSDPIQWLPSQLSGLEGWYRFGRGITVTGSGVSQWDDASGNGNHLVQATDADRPALQGDGSILFDGITQYLHDAFTLIQPSTIYILVKQITWTNGRKITDGNQVNSGAIIQSGTTPNIYPYSGVNGVSAVSEAVLGTYFPIVAVFNGASSLIQVGNNAPSTGDAGATNMGGFYLGANGNGGQEANIQAKEAIVFSTAHDAAIIEKGMDYLQSL